MIRLTRTALTMNAWTSGPTRRAQTINPAVTPTITMTTAIDPQIE
jgi:hypothetical protein